jgi:hypothetical protein
LCSHEWTHCEIAFASRGVISRRRASGVGERVRERVAGRGRGLVAEASPPRRAVSCRCL